ncbi:brain-specific angiogenesis inhibitor 1-associated protein 2-like protein 1a isoform X1 [Girardinichthys multiradiatus]|uniref:brain-specific angiogenesis inhibitor 1-associated protein 2-like protein 1a isoform X1 n=1 Tax=Girardinichthys multiradiatus TaxID=208333 RepID=UPI001FAD2585|nr:brain-specific angiogenesis inhibitor 1-associated protein 2-like protein 1a isoform X1 [Girardinichthys multiradiatus]
MSRTPEVVSKLTESTYKNVMEEFNPALRNLVNLGKSYEKSVSAMTLAGKAYFTAVSKIGENAIVSPISRELGGVLMEIAESHRKLHSELEDNFKIFHREIIAELEKKTDMDVKYMTATFKRYQTDYKLKQESLDRSQTDLKKLRRKGHTKHSSKYDLKENEYLETMSSRQMDMQRFIAEGCREALLEEKRRFWFLAEKHCMFSYQLSNFHEKAKDILRCRLPTWQEKCRNIEQVPDTVATIIEGLSTNPEQSAQVERFNKNNMGSLMPPPAPPLKISPLANMFNPEPRTSLSTSSDLSSDQGSLEEGNLSRSASVSSDLNVGRKSRVKTIFPHTAGNNNTLLSFDHGDIITLLIHEEKDGWLYGELEKTQQHGWFPSSYCRPHTEPVILNSNLSTPVRSLSVASLQEEDEEAQDYEPVLLPPPDYSDARPSKAAVPSTPSSKNTVSLVNGMAKAPFLGGGNPFATVKLRPTVTNDRSAPII